MGFAGRAWCVCVQQGWEVRGDGGWPCGQYHGIRPGEQAMHVAGAVPAAAPR